MKNKLQEINLEIIGMTANFMVSKCRFRRKEYLVREYFDYKYIIVEENGFKYSLYRNGSCLTRFSDIIELPKWLERFSNE